MCDPVSAGMFALNAGGQVMQHQAQGRAVSSRNRARLRNFDLQNKQYLEEVMFDDNEWKNDVQLQDIEQDQLYQAMIRQWSEQDQQLDKIFAQGDQKIEKAIVEMYENEYAGTQTGRTAARLAGKGAKKLGQYKSEVLHKMMMAEDEMTMNKENIQQEAQGKSWGLYEKIRFSPIHGHTPIAPELEAKPGMGGLVLGLAMSGLTAAKAGGLFKAPDIGTGPLGNPLSEATSTLESGAAGGQFMPSNPAGMFQTGVGASANDLTRHLTPMTSPNMDWGGMGSAPWEPVSSSGISASLDQNFFATR